MTVKGSNGPVALMPTKAGRSVMLTRGPCTDSSPRTPRGRLGHDVRRRASPAFRTSKRVSCRWLAWPCSSAEPGGGVDVEEAQEAELDVVWAGERPVALPDWRG